MIGEMGKPFAVIADVHGNVDALRAVLAEIDAQGIQHIVNLGDHFSGPLAAQETAEVLLARNMTAIRGNHDRWLVDQPRHEMAASDAHARDQLSAAAMSWLRSLPATLRLSPDIFLCHGTPSDDNRYWLEQVGPQGVPGPRPLPEVMAETEGTPASLYLCAHTHIARRLDPVPGRVIFNPGSVGCPAYSDDHPVPHRMRAGSPAASFGIVTRRAQGWKTEVHAVPYDTTRMVQMAQAAGRSEWARALESGWLED